MEDLDAQSRPAIRNLVNLRHLNFYKFCKCAGFYRLENQEPTWNPPSKILLDMQPTIIDRRNYSCLEGVLTQFEH